MFMEEEDKSLIKTKNNSSSHVHSLIDDSDPIKSKNKSPRYIDAQFDLEEDNDKAIEKYGDDFSISDDDDEDNSDENNDQVKEMFSSKTAVAAVPQSLPMNINFGVDPFTKQRRGPIEKEPQNIKDEIPNGSIYENMQVLSRSIQSADYRNRVWGTKPEEASESVSYSQSLSSHGPSRPRAFFVTQPAQRINISEETLEESASLETPKY